MKRIRDVHQRQMLLLPPSLNEFIDERLTVRVLDSLIDRVATHSMENILASGGAPFNENNFIGTI